MIQGCYHAIVLAIFPFYMYGFITGVNFNHDDGLYLLGTIIYTAVIFVVTFKVKKKKILFNLNFWFRK